MSATADERARDLDPDQATCSRTPACAGSKPNRSATRCSPSPADLKPEPFGPSVPVFWRTEIDTENQPQARPARWQRPPQPLSRSAPQIPERIPRRVRFPENAEHHRRAATKRTSPRKASRCSTIRLCSSRRGSGRSASCARVRRAADAHRAHVSELALARPPSAEESARALAFLQRRGGEVDSPRGRSRARAVQHEGVHLPPMRPSRVITRREMLPPQRARLWLAGARRAARARRSGAGAHFAPRAQNVILLFMDGGVSQVDSFDPKPRLKAEHGQPFRHEDRRDAVRQQSAPCSRARGNSATAGSAACR